MEYLIVNRHSPESLVSIVNAKLEEGWEPIGGLSVDRQGQNVMFIQAMIKKELSTTEGGTY